MLYNCGSLALLGMPNSVVVWESVDRDDKFVLFLSIDFSIFHYELDILQQADVLQRIACHRDNVGVLAWFDGSDFFAVPE